MDNIETTFEEAFKKVGELVEIFRQNEDRYLSNNYSESQARLDFIDKFFIALGWDVAHDVQTNPYEQEVKVERRGEAGARRKIADYVFLDQSFHNVRFYVEAKKPQKDIDKKDYYFQTIRYGWSSKVPFSVLTDFDQFRVLDCRFEPHIETVTEMAVMKFHYTDYTDELKFREIFHLFSREAVQNGSLDKFSAANTPQKIGIPMQKKLFRDSYQSVDEKFLQTLDDYRERLVIDFKKQNTELSGGALTEISQRTIDRLVFIRFLEDKLIEEKPIIETFGEKRSAWEDFILASKKLNAVYNGIIFRQHGILDSDELKVSDDVFLSICRSLSDAHSSYDFNSIQIHILGSIYERFLGNTVVANETDARIEQKEIVRKAGGVFYTPENIVRYIVSETIGKLIENKSPKQIAKMRFADISCGSGSFLLGIYEYLLRYHTKYYNNPDNRKEAERAGCIETEDGNLRLNLRQRKEILVNNIYGVDIDAQAVEVAQLSLFLRLLEEESTASAHGYQLEFRETMLPSLDKNIICGNSLIDWDFAPPELYSDELELRINPMRYSIAFKKVMDVGGFDAVIGNPPYISVQSGFIEDDVYEYLKSKYKTMERISDYFALFTEKAMKLLKSDGFMGYIIPSTVLMNLSFTKLRRLLLMKAQITDVVHLGDGVFKGVVVPTCTLVSKNQTPAKKSKIIFKSGDNDPYSEQINQTEVLQSEFLTNEHHIFNVIKDKNVKKLLDKITLNARPLSEFLKIREGIKTGRDKEFLSDKPFAENNYPLVKGRDVKPFEINQKLYINYDTNKLSRPQTIEQFNTNEKLLIRRVGANLIAGYDTKGLLCVHTLYTAIPKDEMPEGYSLKFFAALINSPLMDFYYNTTSLQKGNVFPEVRIYRLNSLPVKSLDFAKPKDREIHDKIEAGVTELIKLKSNSGGELTDQMKRLAEQKEQMLTQEINNGICQIYGVDKNDMKFFQ